MKHRGIQKQAGEIMKVLFLQSHGLRSPLTAIRWACGRLRKQSTGPLSREQRYLVDHIYVNTRKLTTALESMLLLARLEERGQGKEIKELCVKELFDRVKTVLSPPSDVTWHIQAPHVHFTADRTLMDAILKDIFTIFIDAPQPGGHAVFIDVSSAKGELVFRFRSSFLLPGASASEALEYALVQPAKVIGGVPGLMLAMAQAVARHLNGSVELEEVVTGEFITDGTVELGESTADEHRIVVRIPASARIVEGSCENTR
ncbi:MAG: histidine kinase dimerization/phospho-acceptor domain-containing protein [Patescibacteria group bacterium]